MFSHDFITHNIGWKILSLVLAGLAWFVINKTISDNGPMQAPVITTIPASFAEVPVALMGSATNTNHYRIMPENVAIEVSGTEQDVKRLQLRQVHAYVDITDAGDDSSFRKTVMVQIAGDCKVLNVTPPTARIERIPIPK